MAAGNLQAATAAPAHNAYTEEGVAGLAHGNRGPPAYNAVHAALAARVVELARDKLAWWPSAQASSGARISRLPPVDGQPC